MTALRNLPEGFFIGGTRMETVRNGTDQRAEQFLGTILVIEDDAVQRQILEDFLLMEERYRVIPVGTGWEGLAAYFEQRPDAVLLDISLPDMNGLELLKRLFVLGDPTPVLVITGLADGAVEKSCLELGAAMVLHKPLRLKNLREALHQALDLPRGRQN